MSGLDAGEKHIYFRKLTKQNAVKQTLGSTYRSSFSEETLKMAHIMKPNVMRSESIKKGDRQWAGAIDLAGPKDEVS